MRLRRGIVLSVVGLSIGGCRTGIDSPVTEQGGHFRDLWSIFLPIAIAVVTLIWGLVLWSVIRYRRRNDTVPDQRQYRIALEVVYTVLPLVIVAALFVLSVGAERRITHVSTHPDERVTVIGFQWGWTFTYPEHGFSVSGTADKPPLLVLPSNRTTQLDLRADDVIHSFWVPRFLTKRDLIPGIENAIDIDPTQVGHWVGHCAEFCGLDHWRMNFEVQIVTPEEFARWAAAAAAARDPYAIPRPDEVR